MPSGEQEGEEAPEIVSRKYHKSAGKESEFLSVYSTLHFGQRGHFGQTCLVQRCHFGQRCWVILVKDAQSFGANMLGHFGQCNNPGAISLKRVNKKQPLHMGLQEQEIVLVHARKEIQYSQ